MTTLLKIIYFFASLIFLLKAILFLYVGIMLYKDNYSQYKTPDDCNKATPSFLNLICPFWSDAKSNCINGMYDNNHNCAPKKSITNVIMYISAGLISALISMICAYYGFKVKGHKHGRHGVRHGTYAEF